MLETYVRKYIWNEKDVRMSHVRKLTFFPINWIYSIKVYQSL